MHGLDEGRRRRRAGAAGGHWTRPGEKDGYDTVRVAQKALRRYSGFTCYAALANHKASNIEEVSYQIR